MADDEDAKKLGASAGSDSNLMACSHQHQILAAAPETDLEQRRPIPVTLYHWRPPTVREKFTVILPPGILQTIKGSASLGTFFLSKDLDIGDTLSVLLTASSYDDPEPTPPSSKLFADLVAQMAMPDKKGRFFQFFSFPVLSDSADDVLGDELFPAWKWAKPDSVYPRKGGFWDDDLHQVLEDGEWSGGKDLILLMRAVSEEVLQAVSRKDVRHTSFDGVLKSASWGPL
ncbi:df1a12f7-6e9b-4f6b-82d1-3f3f6c146925 [Thermothielavioides terrestris]|uniref:Df1a12f7-6e9b-4f6b-82d1-3f3f6c146925 n=1 Tax=Thermothielavioides terrestris TaxID=2587410 RepID=A0A3S5CXV3_9PEZI|nr:df1a12f7-6e9b-4f6b-82d1-3f3f6c146925 [Thermothielavioides terrestris]